MPTLEMISSPEISPKQRLWISMARLAALVNQPLLSTSSGSQAPRKYHWPPHQTSTQAWLSSQWAHRGV